MKNQKQQLFIPHFLVACFLTLVFGFSTHAETLELKQSTLEVTQSPFWAYQWIQKGHKGISLKSINSYEQSFLLTFSGSDFVYLNQQNATEVKKIDEHTLVWKYSDAQVDYERLYQVKDDFVEVNFKVHFKSKAPEKAYLSLVSTSPKDDHEERDREVLYYSNSSIERHQVAKSIEPTEINQPVKWIGTSNKYFVLVAIPKTSEKALMQTVAEKTAQISLQLPVESGQINGQIKLAFLPKELTVLRGIDQTLDTTVNLGFFTFIAYPILWFLKWINQFTHNFGVAIIVLTIIIKILLFPLTLKSVKGMRKMSEFQPKIKALQEKHKDDKVKLNQEMMALMKNTGYNPLSGCLPMILQMPIFFALYSVLYAAVDLYRAPFAFWITDLSAKDPYFITPVLMTLLMFLQTKLTPPNPGVDPTQQKVMQFMPLMFGAFMLTIPAGLCLYMLVNAFMSILQQLYLNKKLGVSSGVAGMAGF